MVLYIKIKLGNRILSISDVSRLLFLDCILYKYIFRQLYNSDYKEATSDSATGTH